MSYTTLSAFFFFNDTATTEIYTLSLHDALPISTGAGPGPAASQAGWRRLRPTHAALFSPETRSNQRVSGEKDRKSTRLNSSHDQISYAVFCLKKKKSRVTSCAARNARC